MWLPFTLRQGPQWAASRAAIDPVPARFSEHVRAMEYALKRDPVGWTEGFLDGRDDLRVYRSTDAFFRYEIVIFVRVDEFAHLCELKWIDLRNLAPDEDVDEPPQGAP